MLCDVVDKTKAAERRSALNGAAVRRRRPQPHRSDVYALLALAKEKGWKWWYSACHLDGRDVPPSSGIDYVAALEAKLTELGIGKIATVSGRYYAMDRDKRWERVEKAYQALVLRQGETAASAK